MSFIGTQLPSHGSPDIFSDFPNRLSTLSRQHWIDFVTGEARASLRDFGAREIENNAKTGSPAPSRRAREQLFRLVADVPLLLESDGGFGIGLVLPIGARGGRVVFEEHDGVLMMVVVPHRMVNGCSRGNRNRTQDHRGG